MRPLILLALIFGQVQLFGQIKKNKINGQWIINNKDSSYFLNDTLSLDSDVTFKLTDPDGCNFILWDISPKEAKILTAENCDGTWDKKVLKSDRTIKLELIEDDYYVIIRNNKIVEETYLVINYLEDKFDGKEKWKGFGLVRQTKK